MDQARRALKNSELYADVKEAEAERKLAHDRHLRALGALASTALSLSLSDLQ